ncbi:MAG: hypothetical protein KDA87_18770 [Planctomycetales bacterium]|nr:hypothetical protein [Planctomycetales bacterium]
MGKLTDIMDNGGDFISDWNSIEAAEDFPPLPAGDYVGDLMDATLSTSRQGTPCWTAMFEVQRPAEYVGRRIWHSFWLSKKALPMTKRDLAKLGVTDPAQLEQPLPVIFRCKLRIAIRTSDDGQQYNQVLRFEVVDTIEFEPDEFAPDDRTDDGDEHAHDVF